MPKWICRREEQGLLLPIITALKKQIKSSLRLKKLAERSLAIKANATSATDIKAVFSQTVEQFGGVDILINNAGGMVQRVKFEELTEDVWDEVYDLNVKSIFLATKEVVPIMKKKNGGVIINTASIRPGNGGGPGAIHYASAKGAVLTLTKGLAKELLPYNIRVNGIRCDQYTVS